MVVKCDYSLCDCIFDYTKNLKDLKSDQDDYYRVSPQLPEPLFTQNKERREAIAAAKKLNNTLDDAKKVKIEVKSVFSI